MTLDDRLKKRAVSQSNKYNSHVSGIEHGSSHSSNGGYTVGPDRILGSAARGRTRNRKRFKGRGSRNWVFIRKLKQKTMNYALGIKVRTRGDLSTKWKTVGFVLCLGITSFVVFSGHFSGHFSGDVTETRKLRRKIIKRQPEFKILFPHRSSSQRFFQIDPIKLGPDDDRDYGGLEIEDFDGKAREIEDDDYLWVSDFRGPDHERDDDYDPYMAFDDDFIRGTDGTMNVQTGSVCHRISSHRVSFQNCNTIFELEWLDNNVKYLNEGSYRQVFSLQHSFLQHNESIAVKDMYQTNGFQSGDYEFMRMDAMVAERLTSSPNIYDIYGFCGLSILSEFFPYGDLEDMAITRGDGYLLTEEAQEDYILDLEPYNDISNHLRLVWSLQMAEALADLHGHVDGVITHQDIQLSQYLLNSDQKLVKLNDFNRAEFMLYDEKKKEYCKYGEGKGNGNWRAPEEYFDYDLTEQVDVFALANNMYVLLTGLNPFYDTDSDKLAVHRVKQGIKPYIDQRYFNERSLAEAKLAEIINRCYAYKPEDRPSIFEVVKFLRDALKQVEESDRHSDNLKSQ